MKNLILLLGLYYLTSFVLIYLLWDVFIFDPFIEARNYPDKVSTIFFLLLAEIPRTLALFFCSLYFLRLNTVYKSWIIFVFILFASDLYLAYLAGPFKTDNFINKAAFFLEILCFSGYLYKKTNFKKV